jgi:UPF0755 protein
MVRSPENSNLPKRPSSSKKRAPTKRTTSRRRSDRDQKPAPSQRPNDTLKHLITVACIGLVILVVTVWQGLFRSIPISGSSEILTVKQGQTYTSLIKQLAERDQIHLSIIARIYQRLFIHNTLKAGAYEIRRGTSVKQLLRMLSDGEAAQMNRVLLVEGTTFAQLMQHLDDDPKVTHTLSGLSNEQILKKLQIDQTHPEGWFAPDTYYFAQGETDAFILKHLYKEQKRVLDDAWEQRASGLPYRNEYEALIMASIVEKETGVADERAKVAGVFVRRLQQGMRLQTDPTVIYGMGSNYQGKITRQDLLTPTAYNTYTIDGLPPTPIAMPGKASIEAALHPAEGKSLYFVATGTGGHTFSDNLEQHNQAVAHYLDVLRQQKVAGN